MAGKADPPQRVVVTGMGCLTPLGMDVASTWEAAVQGRSGVGQISQFDASGYPATIAGEVRGPIDLADIPVKEARRLDRVVALAIPATREALSDSGLEVGDHNRDRIGVALGSGIGGLGTILENHKRLLERGPRRVSPFSVPMALGNMPAGYISIQHGLRGPNLCHVSACASSAHSIGEAARLIQRGEADVMVAGGAEAAIVTYTLAGFAAMHALSKRNDEPERASRPFDRERDGFIVGEGAAVFVLESLSHARTRGATPRAEILGYGASADAFHMVAPDETAAGQIRCIELALADAALTPGEIDYVNAHATSTPAGDAVETRAIRTVFGDEADRTPVSSTKSMMGHLLGAAGAAEAVLCVKAMEDQLLPPTINLDHPDPECALDHVAGKARPARVRAVLSNSFGFGGTNAALVFGAFDA
jgi:3-oxoacyl-[acyl-carrier-protein] synthase II